VLGSYAPLSTTDTASSTAPVPRFVQNPAATFPINLAACETRLLFPFVTSIPGWDTGIAISNTTVDPFGTAAQNGACTLYFYGSPSNSTQTSSTISAGSQLLFAMSQGNAAQNINALTGFTGYLIARCNFQYAHGYAFISDLGVNKYAQGYIALVIGGGLTSRYSINPAEASGSVSLDAWANIKSRRGASPSGFFASGGTFPAAPCRLFPCCIPIQHRPKGVAACITAAGLTAHPGSGLRRSATLLLAIQPASENSLRSFLPPRNSAKL
jgi:hypothetical protein